MLLIISNSQDATVDYCIDAIRASGIHFLRLDTDSLISRTSLHFEVLRPCIFVDSVSYSPDDFSNVWYRRPERLKHPDFDESPESMFVQEEWAEALEGFLAHIKESKWVNHPVRNAQASRKLEQLSKASAAGLTVPSSLVTQDEERFRRFYHQHSGRVIAKPLATGYIERSASEHDSLIYTNRVLAGDVDDLDDLRTCPTFFQEEIDKHSDVRITVIDGRFFAVEITASDSDGRQRCDIRRNNMDDVTYRRIDLPDLIEARLSSLIRQYGLRFAAIDMAITSAGDWIFFEINPNGQWAWLDQAGATTITDGFIDAFRPKAAASV